LHINYISESILSKQEPERLRKTPKGLAPKSENQIEKIGHAKRQVKED